MKPDSANNKTNPLEVPLRLDRVWGIRCLRTENLLVQDHDAEGHLWAMRGMWAYRCKKGEKLFVRQYHIPSGSLLYWLRNFALVRRLTHKETCVELLTLPGGAVCAMSGGHMWYRPSNKARFQKTLTLRHYGIGIGRGIFSAGLVRLKDGTILFGEYFNNPKYSDVRLYISKDDGRTWQVLHTFQPGEIRHVHAVQQDPYTGKMWVCTGDKDQESLIAWSMDAGQTLHPIGKGSQMWRATMLVFTEDAVIWGADTWKSSHSGIYRWNRKTKEVTKLISVPAGIIHSTQLACGTIVMSTARGKGYSNERDDKARLLISTDGVTVTELPCETWNHSTRSGAEVLRFERTQGSTDLYLTCIDTKEHNGDLIVVSPKTLEQIAHNTGKRP